MRATVTIKGIATTEHAIASLATRVLCVTFVLAPMTVITMVIASTDLAAALLVTVVLIALSAPAPMIAPVAARAVNLCASVMRVSPVSTVR